MNPAGGSGFSFGQQAAITTSASTNGFSFGKTNTNTATVAPLTSAGSGGFSFSQGSTPAGGFSFAQTNPLTAQTPAAPTTSTLTGLLSSTNTPAAANTTFNFNPTNASTPTGLGLGQPISTPATSFGQTPQQQPPGGFGFGKVAAPTAASAAPTSGGFSFGIAANPLNPVAPLSTAAAPAAALTPGGFSFGIAANPLNPVAPLSTATMPTAALTSATPSLLGSALFQPATAAASSVSPATPTPSLFGQAIQATNLSSVAAISTPASSTLAFPQSSLFNTASSASVIQPATATASIGFGITTTQPLSMPSLFAIPQSTTSTPSTGLNFPAPASSGTTGFNLALNASAASQPTSSIFSSASATPTATIGLGGSVPTTLTATSGGLGGFQPASSQPGAVTAGKGDSNRQWSKESQVPQEIAIAVAELESYKDAEKRCAEQNVRHTAAPFHKLVDDTNKLRQHILNLDNQHSQLHVSANKLKASVIQESENVEMARRTQATPASAQGENTAPESYFLRVVRSFEERMAFCRARIEEVERCGVRGGAALQHAATAEDMKEVLKKEHEMVKAMAARLYSLHSQLLHFSGTAQSLHPTLQPEALFKPGASHAQLQSSAISRSHDNHLKQPALGEGGSGLVTFQTGQLRAKALSLGGAAPPPTVPLSQAINNPLGSTFGTSAFNFNTSSTLAKPGGLFSSTTPSFAPAIPAGGGLFGNTVSTPAFGTVKGFKKLENEDDTQKKRRL